MNERGEGAIHLFSQEHRYWDDTDVPAVGFNQQVRMVNKSSLWHSDWHLLL